MYSVWKYPLDFATGIRLNMPVGAKILDAQMQDDKITLWALVNTSNDVEKRSFAIVGTGWDLDEEFLSKGPVYIATVQKGAYVWHIFEFLLTNS